jgi:hypothetical protein
MNPKIEFKLLETIYDFREMTLKSAKFKNKEIGNKKLLTLELIFSDNHINKTMVLVLDKDLTTGDYQNIYEQIIK